MKIKRLEAEVERLRDRIRDEAIRIVDGQRGYTAEFAPDPAVHRQWYDREEERILGNAS